MEIRIPIPENRTPKKPRRVIDPETSRKVMEEVRTQASDAAARALTPKS